MSVPLKFGDEAHTFSFSPACTAPRTVFQLSSGLMDLLNIRFLVAEEDLTSEDLLMGLPVLRHFRIDSKTLLDNIHISIDGMDCTAGEF